MRALGAFLFVLTVPTAWAQAPDEDPESPRTVRRVHLPPDRVLPPREVNPGARLAEPTPATAVVVEPSTGKRYRLSVSPGEEEEANPQPADAELPGLFDVTLARAALEAEKDGRLFLDFAIVVGHREITSTFRGPRGQVLTRQRERREGTLAGSCRVQPDQPVAVATVGSRPLTLVITPAAESPERDAHAIGGGGAAPNDPGRQAAPVRLQRSYRLQLSRDDGGGDPAEEIAGVLVSSRNTSLPIRAEALRTGGLTHALFGKFEAAVSEETDGSVSLEFDFGCSTPFPVGPNVEFVQESTKGTVNVAAGETMRFFERGRAAWMLTLSPAEPDAKDAPPNAADDAVPPLARHRRITLGLERPGGDKASATILTSSPRIVLHPALSFGNAPGDTIPVNLDATIHELPDRRILMEYAMDTRLAVPSPEGGPTGFWKSACRGSVFLNRGEAVTLWRSADQTFSLQLDGAPPPAAGGGEAAELPSHLDRNYLVRVARHHNGATTAETALLSAATSLEFDTFSSEARDGGQAIPFVVLAKSSLEIMPGRAIAIDYDMVLGQTPAPAGKGEAPPHHRPAKGQAILRPGEEVEVLEAGDHSYRLSVELPERSGATPAAP